MLKDKILRGENGIVLYGITPPKLHQPPEKIREIAARQMERLRGIEVDGLIVYDLQEESDRTKEERPFPFLQTIDPHIYAVEHLGALDLPKIVYRCVGKYERDEFADWLAAAPGQDRCSVFVGVTADNQAVKLTLADAYRMARVLAPGLIVGGVTIPERHRLTRDEHLRVQNKMDNGCRFFVSQAVYNVEAAKDFISDYYYHCSERGLAMAPIILTLTPCGSEKTLAFMKWLGISIPRWLENDLLHSQDVLERSMVLLREVHLDLCEFAREKGVPIGFNVESVSVRKVEIDASIELVKEVRAKTKRLLGTGI